MRAKTNLLFEKYFYQQLVIYLFIHSFIDGDYVNAMAQMGRPKANL